MSTNYVPQPPVDPAVSATGPTPIQRFFAWTRRLGVVRPGDNRVFGGVAAAIANRIGMQPWLVRVILLALILFAGLSIWFYVAAWILLPDGRTGTIPLERWIS